MTVDDYSSGLNVIRHQNKLGTAISDSGTGGPRRRQQIGSGARCAGSFYGIYWTHDKDDPGHSCPNKRSEVRGNQDKTMPNIATFCTPQPPAVDLDSITQISVSLSLGDGTVFFNVAHRSLGGSIYERSKQYHVYTRALGNGDGWQWLRQRLSDINTWMVGELKPTGDRSYRYREWIYHADPRIIGFDKGQSVTVAACGG
jgi:hypothetical protein